MSEDDSNKEETGRERGSDVGGEEMCGGDSIGGERGA